VCQNCGACGLSAGCVGGEIGVGEGEDEGQGAGGVVEDPFFGQGGGGEEGFFEEESDGGEEVADGVGTGWDEEFVEGGEG